MSDPYCTEVRCISPARWHWRLLVCGAVRAEGVALTAQEALAQAGERRRKVEWEEEGIDLADWPQAPPGAL